MTKIKLGFEEDKRLKLKFRNIPVSIHYEGKVIHFKSKLEYRWANHLELLKQAGEIKGWSYETHTFVFDNVGLRNWKVDFEVRNNDDTFEYFEAKGKLRKSDIDKLKLLNRDRPEVEVTYVFARKPKISCLLYTSPSPRDQRGSRMPSSA